MTELILTNRKVLCIGGGQVAWRKVAGLAECGARIMVVAPQLHPELARWQAEGRLFYRADSFQEALLDEAPRPALVFAATGEEGLNRRIAHLAAARDLWCNSADDPACSGFLVPAVVRRGAVTVAATTGGLSPALSRLLKERLDRLLEPGWGQVAQLFGAWRQRVKVSLVDAAHRQQFWRQTCLALEEENRLQRSQDNESWLEERLQRAIDDQKTGG
ncbi:MAG: bifunctional precorrin-2 dehydrogenase/sirohydrochlorin ferrochelatase [Magnetococcales bacterium]|nr:bifunctional precorrin-2 dehydrogenase/sirohydrochlorin ferrochelatase [Magnetococcales bacterium]MBF0115974.1 bifunctional precorrin-2 dehydrogenase/sirohydrochlorin ferrochelatase [Magnetococcales bacterium]